MDERLNTSQLLRKDMRFVTLSLGVLCTIGLFSALTRDADRRSRHSLEQTHQSTLRLIARDVDDLRQQLIRATTDQAAANLYQTLLFRRDLGGTIGVQDSRMSAPPIPIQNAGSSVFRASLPSGTSVFTEVLADGFDSLDRTAVNAPKDAATLNSRIENTNLTLVSKLSLHEGRELAYWLTGGSAGLWLLLTLAAHRLERARRRRILEAQEWMKAAMVDFRFGRLPAPATPALLASPEGALLDQLSSTLNQDMPYYVGVANRMIDNNTRLGSWAMFQARLNTLLVDLRPQERFVLGKIHFSKNTSTKEVVAGMAQELGLTGEYIQCMFSDNTLAFAFRTEGQENLLYGVFSPLRYLVDSNLLLPGNFEATIFVLNHQSHYVSSDALVEKLQLNHAPAFASRNPAIPATLAPHLILHEGLPAPKVTVFSLIQLLYLDGHMLQTGIAEATRRTPVASSGAGAQAALPPKRSEPAPVTVSEEAAEELEFEEAPKPRKRRKRRKSLGRMPDLPPPPASETWN